MGRGRPVIAALYVQKNGVYYGLPDVDPWDEERDARKYAGPWPVVAHPPCARWSLLAGLVEARGGKKRGEDDGCFEAALRAVRTWGGVLEHPAHSAAFVAHGLVEPVGRGWQRCLDGGWTAEVDQGRYGHSARKPTWLYVYGGPPFPLDWERGVDRPHPTKKARRTGRPLSRLDCMSSRARSRTPEAFRDLLLDLAITVGWPESLRRRE